MLRCVGCWLALLHKLLVWEHLFGRTALVGLLKAQVVSKWLQVRGLPSHVLVCCCAQQYGLGLVCNNQHGRLALITRRKSGVKCGGMECTVHTIQLPYKLHATRSNNFYIAKLCERLGDGTNVARKCTPCKPHKRKLDMRTCRPIAAQIMPCFCPV